MTLVSILMAAVHASSMLAPVQAKPALGLTLSLKMDHSSVMTHEYTGATVTIENQGDRDFVIQELFGSSNELRYYARDSNGALVSNLDYGALDGGMEMVTRVVKLRPGFFYGAHAQGVRLNDKGTYTVWCVLTKPDLTELIGPAVWHGQISSPSVRVVVR